MNLLTKTYEIMQGPQPPSCSAYSDVCVSQWRALLESDPQEAEVQEFLGRNPALVPGAWTPGVKSGHYPLHCALISQPELPGLRSRRPDFMWISMHSGAWYPTLVEIERPSKRIFTAAGIPSADFTQARNQLAQWRTWFASPANCQLFIEAYGVPDHVRRFRQMVPHMILIYGHREEFEDSPELSQHRQSLLTGNDEALISFDRLAFDCELTDAITTKVKSSGRYKAVAIPPLFRFGPSLAERLLAVDGVEDALCNTPLISEERRQFLKSRLSYWRDWASKGGKGLIYGGDWE